MCFAADVYDTWGESRAFFGNNAYRIDRHSFPVQQADAGYGYATAWENQLHPVIKHGAGQKAVRHALGFLKEACFQAQAKMENIRRRASHPALPESIAVPNFFPTCSLPTLNTVWWNGRERWPHLRRCRG